MCSSGPKVICRGVPPALDTVKICSELAWARTKAIKVPSGDQAGQSCWVQEA
jgi:hypothetical protein